jgi:hypothetical protein
MLRIDDIHAFGVIGMRVGGKFLNCLARYALMMWRQSEQKGLAKARDIWYNKT